MIPMRQIILGLLSFVYITPLFAAQSVLPINWLESLGALAAVLALILLWHGF